MRLTFKKRCDPDNAEFDFTNVTLTCEVVSLVNVLEAFVDFLRAIGFSYVEDLEYTERRN